MTDISHILVPTDGSDGALHAAELAGNFARSLGAKVTLLYVQDDAHILSNAWAASNLPVDGEEDSSSVERVRSSLEKHAHENELPATAEALGKLAKEPDSIVTWGHSSEEICRYATNHNVDLIVIGSHGRSGLKRAFLGSVSQAVANQASCPVTLVK
ncbi:MAG: universal stress protein [Gammaproteobacteria bacterium]|nr:universal stress protein [Gammaproteobacteria bacterium]